jgi:HSP20 family protein
MIMSEQSQTQSEIPEGSARVAVVGETNPLPSLRTTERRLTAPPIDIFESDEGLVLRADLPGVAPEGLELQVQDNKLSLFGRVTHPIPEGGRLVHQEYEESDFLRSFILSEEVDHERIEAKLSGGVLEVLLPKLHRPEPRRIHVQTE